MLSEVRQVRKLESGNPHMHMEIHSNQSSWFK